MHKIEQRICEDRKKVTRNCIQNLVSVFSCLGNLPTFPHQLHPHDPHGLHLVNSLPGHLEVHHDQVLLPGRHALHPTKVQNTSHSWLW